jgi:hypothetical protein
MKHLAELGYVEGNTIAVECILARGQLDQLPQLAEELVSRGYLPKDGKPLCGAALKSFMAKYSKEACASQEVFVEPGC